MRRIVLLLTILGVSAAILHAASEQESIRRVKYKGGPSYIYRVYLTDKKGVFAPTASNELKFSVKGPGEILAVDAGDPTCLTPFHSDSIKAFNGLASVIIKVKPGAKGKIVVTATSNGLKKGKTKIKHL